MISRAALAVAILLVPQLAGAAIGNYKDQKREVEISNSQLMIDATGTILVQPATSSVAVYGVHDTQLLIGTTEPILIDDPYTHIPLGQFPLHGSNNKFGRSDDVDAEATDVWGMANTTDDQILWLRPTTNRVHELYSTDADDSGPSGNGCRTLKVQGTGHGDFSVASETLTMNGQSYVPTLNTYSRINRMSCQTFGTTSMNEGNIYAIAQVDASSQNVITANFGQSLHAIWSCPLGHTCLVTNYYASMNKSGGASGAADITLFTRSNADNGESGWTVKHVLGLITTGTSYFQHKFMPYFKVSEKTDIKIQAFGSTANLDVSAGFDVIEVLD